MASGYTRPPLPTSTISRRLFKANFVGECNQHVFASGRGVLPGAPPQKLKHHHYPSDIGSACSMVSPFPGTCCHPHSAAARKRSGAARGTSPRPGASMRRPSCAVTGRRGPNPGRSPDGSSAEWPASRCPHQNMGKNTGNCK